MLKGVPFFSEQDRGEGRHLLVGVVLQASQVEVGISSEETGNNAGPSLLSVLSGVSCMSVNKIEARGDIYLLA
jgi:hypothetical protein